MDYLVLEFFDDFHASWEKKPLKFHSNKVRALLAYLVIESNRPHSREKLATLFWEENDYRTALTNLRNALVHLRSALSELWAQTNSLPLELVTTRTTVQLNVGEHPQISVDVLEFDRLIQACETHSHLAITRCYLCLTRLTRAVELYRGDLLTRLNLPQAYAFEEWISIERKRRYQQFFDALQILVDHYAALGSDAEVQQYAERILTVEPWNEHAHRQLMLAKSRRGNIDVVRAQYEALRRVLWDELGILPSNETEQLMKSLTRSNKPASAPRYRIPAALTPIVGYETELAQIIEYLWDPECRLLTVLGPGGVGKTQLGLKAARRASQLDSFPDGVCFVQLDEIRTVEALGITVGAAVGLPADYIEFVDGAKDRRMLLILDGIEHLLIEQDKHQRVVDSVRGLLEAGPGLKFLVTSSIPLYMQAEWRLVLPGLTYPPLTSPVQADESLRRYSAIDLFLGISSRIHQSTSLSPDDWKAIADICQTVEGLPLAIEIAAAWTDQLSFEEIARAIHHNFDFLATSMRDMPARHRSIRAVLETSWQLLSPDERYVLSQASTLPMSFTEQVMVDLMPRLNQNELTHTLTRLVDKSWLRREIDEIYRWQTLTYRFVSEHRPKIEADSV